MEKLNKLIQEQFAKMCASGNLFRVVHSGGEVWNKYINSFNEGDNPKFRDPESSEHNCNHCKNFIRRYGNIVAIGSNYEIITMFDITIEGEYKAPMAKMSEFIKGSKIANIFLETFDELNSLPYEACKKTNSVFRLGIEKNVKRYTKEEAEKFGVVKPDEIRTFHHFFLDLPKQFVDMSGKSIDTIMAGYRDSKNLLMRGLSEISLDTLELVRDLINQNSLLDGATHLHKITEFIKLKQEFDTIPLVDRDVWCWIKSYDNKYARFRNELIGVLCTELSEGKEINEACKAWNVRVDPVNYMKATAPISKKQIEEAKKFVEDNGYTESFDRRLATIDDIKVSEILHTNAGDGKIKSVSIFDGVKSSKSRHKRSEFDKLEEVTIDKFMTDILPSCTSVEALLLDTHLKNMVTMTTANNPDSKPIFKWSNNYSWSYEGNIAGKSALKEAVKSKGGVVDGVLRFSISWGDNDGDMSDLDAWCSQPTHQSIGYNTGFRKDRGNEFSNCGGQLDVDNTGGTSQIKVENIYFKNISSMKNGQYKFWVNQFSTKSSKGFKAEIEFNGQIFSYAHTNPIRTGNNVHVATVTLKDGEFTIEHKLPPADDFSNTEVYGLESGQFHKVNLVCLSPNHWGENKVGNKHYFFMLENCINPNAVRGFHNENLITELLDHRKVMEVLGATAMIPSTPKQLSGLGFNATMKDELIVKLGGSFKRMLKIKF